MNVQTEQPQIIPANWSVGCTVKAFTTTRNGGVSLPPWDSLNLATHVNDNPENVQKNRALLKQNCGLPSEPVWLEQVHSDKVIRLTAENKTQSFKADASYTTEKKIVCCVMTADCLPVLFCNKQANWVAAAHAGWKGIANGILKNVVNLYLQQPDSKLEDLRVWIGPAISGKVYQVGKDVKQAFIQQDSILQKAFTKQDEQHELLNSAYAACLQLMNLGLTEQQITSEDFCTFKDNKRFFSYRRDGINTGRMASMIWLDD